jgi:hypothetical protein
MDIFSDKPLTIKEIWRTAFRLYGKSFTKTWYLGTLVGIIVTLSLVVNMLYLDRDITFKTAILAISLVITLVVVYLTALMLLRIYYTGKNQSYALTESMHFVNLHYLKIAMAALVVFIFYSLGMFALVLPGIFIFVLFTMVQPLILFDEQGVIAALKGSCCLVWGNWWRTFAVVFPLILVNYWMSFAVQYAVSQYNWYIASSNVLLTVFFYPLFYTCILVIFNDLKLRKSNLNSNRVSVVN